jgi:hypothetical protein
MVTAAFQQAPSILPHARTSDSSSCPPVSESTVFRLKTPEGYRHITYRELISSPGPFQGIMGLGLKPGGRVAILSENRPEWVIVIWASSRPANCRPARSSPSRRMEASAGRLRGAGDFVSGLCCPGSALFCATFLAQRLVCFDRLGEIETLGPSWPASRNGPCQGVRLLAFREPA